MDIQRQRLHLPIFRFLNNLSIPFISYPFPWLLRVYYPPPSSLFTTNSPLSTYHPLTPLYFFLVLRNIRWRQIFVFHGPSSQMVQKKKMMIIFWRMKFHGQKKNMVTLYIFLCIDFFLIIRNNVIRNRAQEHLGICIQPNNKRQSYYYGNK